VLDYSIKYGNRAEKIIAAAQEKGDPIPEELIPPEIDTFNGFYWEAFNELDSERPRYECSIGSLPWSKIKEFSDVYFDKFDDYIQFLEIIRQVDNHWVKAVNDKNRQEFEKNKPKAKR